MSKEQEQRFQEMQMKNQKVKEHAMKINAQIEHAQETSIKLKEAALKKFGESDLNKLKEMLSSWDQENEAILKTYQEDGLKLSQEVQNKDNLIKQIQQKE